MGSVWLGENVGVEHGVVEAILLDRDAAREWIEEERERSIEDGRRMEEFETEQGEEYGHRRVEGFWMPTEIERLEGGEGWKFRETQGNISDTVRIERIEVPYRRRRPTPPESGGEDDGS